VFLLAQDMELALELVQLLVVPFVFFPSLGMKSGAEARTQQRGEKTGQSTSRETTNASLPSAEGKGWRWLI
jgi:hypothetical protein